MSYGCAGRRDARRKTAVERIAKSISDIQRDLESGLKAAKKPGLSEAEKAGIETFNKGLKSKIGRAEECLRRTNANMGKGTCAMQKKE